MEAAGRSIFMPIDNNPQLNVEFKLEDFLDEEFDVTGPLRAECASPSLWLKCALVYHKLGNYHKFLEICSEVLKVEGVDNEVLRRKYEGYKREFSQVNLALAGHDIEMALKNPPNASKLLTTASSWVDMAFQRIDRSNSLVDHMSFLRAVINILASKHNVIQGYGESSSLSSIETRKDILSNLIEANFLYQLKKYKKALEKYVEILMRFGSKAPVSVRMGLGLCYYKLHQNEKAQLCFERVLELEPNNIEALVALAVLDLNAKQFKRGMNYVAQAFQINPKEPRVLALLANFYFGQNEITKAKSLLDRITLGSSSTENALSVFVKYLRACCLHASNERRPALTWYEEASKAGPPFANLCNFHSAQLNTRTKKKEEALKSLEMVLKDNPNCVEVLRISGSLKIQLSPHPADQKIGCERLQKVVERQPDDYETLIEIAQTLEATNPKQSLLYYTRAVKVIEEQRERLGIMVPAELWNNIGALRYKLQFYEEAEKAFQQAIQTGDPVGHNYFHPDNITTTYNLARLYEKLHLIQKAQSLYESILSHFPTYTDCLLRLGWIAQSKGDVKTAISFYERCDEVSNQTQKPPAKRSLDALTMLANLQAERGDWNKADSLYRKILQIDEKDTYANLAIANMYFTLHYDKPHKSKDLLTRAYTAYCKLLGKNGHNVYAANGVACVLAVHGLLNEARDAFFDIKEYIPNHADAWINLAHLYVKQGHYGLAVKFYRLASQSLLNCDPKILLNLAHAHFLDKDYANARDKILRAIHIEPNNQRLWYNLAIVMQQHCIHVVTNSDSCSVTDAQQAKIRLVQTEKLLGRLSQQESHHFKKSVVVSALALCADLAPLIDNALVLAEQRLQAEQEIILKRKLFEQEMLLKRKEEEEDRKRKHQEAQERLKDISVVAIEVFATNDTSGSRRKRRKLDEEEEAPVGMDEEDDEHANYDQADQSTDTPLSPSSKKRKREAKKQKKQQRKKRSQKTSSEEGNGDRDESPVATNERDEILDLYPEPEGLPSFEFSKRARRIIDEDDDDEDDGNNVVVDVAPKDAAEEPLLESD